MCGICGVLLEHPPGEEDRAAVRRMADWLAHRGPDGMGFWNGGTVAFGHRRLAIIDVEGGAQPMLNENGEIAVVFNGEIYNFMQLRAQLMDRGHEFRTRCDTEVLLHGYEEWGQALPEHLRGMFAFVIHDSGRQQSLLARDRFGVKPLYYHHDAGAGRLVFASEIKALFAHPSVPRRANASAIPEYLRFRSVSGSATMFDSVRQLEPGHSFLVRKEGVSKRCYWSPDVPVHAAWGNLVGPGRDLLVDAVTSRLVSDVPLGTITSGGLDSSLVSAIAATSLPHIDTFCAGFDDPALDERPFARGIARHIGSRHHEIIVRSNHIATELDAATWAYDEPLSHPNSIPMHLVFRAAKLDAGVTVLLSGEGADEVFGGYDWYRWAVRRERLRHVPGLAGLASVLPGSRAATLRRLLHDDYLIDANAAAGWRDTGGLTPGGGGDLTRRASWPAGRDGPDGLFIFDQRTYLPPLLQRQDRMSMAAGIEARVPFLDHPLVEWANALPWRAKLQRSRPKALLRAAARQWLPASTIDRKKVGFALPLQRWLAEETVLAPSVDRLRDPSPAFRELISISGVEPILAEHARGGTGQADVIWTLLALERWADLFLGASLTPVRLPGSTSGSLVLETDPIAASGGSEAGRP